MKKQKREGKSVPTDSPNLARVHSLGEKDSTPKAHWKKKAIETTHIFSDFRPHLSARAFMTHALCPGGHCLIKAQS